MIVDRLLLVLFLCFAWFYYVVCMMFIALQLERFLCRECGKVKCSCSASVIVDQTSDNVASTKEIKNDTEEYVVEYRKTRELTRQLSKSDKPDDIPKKPPRNSLNRPSEPFERSNGDSGKLRRSFAVRSREGLENLLNLASIRKGHEQGKAKQGLK